MSKRRDHKFHREGDRRYDPEYQSLLPSRKKPVQASYPLLKGLYSLPLIGSTIRWCAECLGADQAPTDNVAQPSPASPETSEPELPEFRAIIGSPTGAGAALGTVDEHTARITTSPPASARRRTLTLKLKASTLSATPSPPPPQQQSTPNRPASATGHPHLRVTVHNDPTDPTLRRTQSAINLYIPGHTTPTGQRTPATPTGRMTPASKSASLRSASLKPEQGNTNPETPEFVTAYNKYFKEVYSAGHPIYVPSEQRMMRAGISRAWRLTPDVEQNGYVVHEVGGGDARTFPILLQSARLMRSRGGNGVLYRNFDCTEEGLRAFERRHIFAPNGEVRRDPKAPQEPLWKKMPTNQSGQTVWTSPSQNITVHLNLVDPNPTEQRLHALTNGRQADLLIYGWYNGGAHTTTDEMQQQNLRCYATTLAPHGIIISSIPNWRRKQKEQVEFSILRELFKMAVVLEAPNVSDKDLDLINTVLRQTANAQDIFARYNAEQRHDTWYAITKEERAALRTKSKELPLLGNWLALQDDLNAALREPRPSKDKGPDWPTLAGTLKKTLNAQLRSDPASSKIWQNLDTLVNGTENAPLQWSAIQNQLHAAMHVYLADIAEPATARAFYAGSPHSAHAQAPHAELDSSEPPLSLPPAAKAQRRTALRALAFGGGASAEETAPLQQQPSEIKSEISRYPFPLYLRTMASVVQTAVAAVNKDSNTFPPALNSHALSQAFLQSVTTPKNNPLLKGVTPEQTEEHRHAVEHLDPAKQPFMIFARRVLNDLYLLNDFDTFCDQISDNITRQTQELKAQGINDPAEWKERGIIDPPLLDRLSMFLAEQLHIDPTTKRPDNLEEEGACLYYPDVTGNEPGQTRFYIPYKPFGSPADAVVQFSKEFDITYAGPSLLTPLPTIQEAQFTRWQHIDGHFCAHPQTVIRDTRPRTRNTPNDSATAAAHGEIKSKLGADATIELPHDRDMATTSRAQKIGGTSETTARARNQQAHIHDITEVKFRSDPVLTIATPPGMVTAPPPSQAEQASKEQLRSSNMAWAARRNAAPTTKTEQQSVIEQLLGKHGYRIKDVQYAELAGYKNLPPGTENPRQIHRNALFPREEGQVFGGGPAVGAPKAMSR